MPSALEVCPSPQGEGCVAPAAEMDPGGAGSHMASPGPAAKYPATQALQAVLPGWGWALPGGLGGGERERRGSVGRVRQSWRGRLRATALREACRGLLCAVRRYPSQSCRDAARDSPCPPHQGSQVPVVALW